MAAAARRPQPPGALLPLLLPALLGVPAVAGGGSVLVCLGGKLRDLERTARDIAEQLLAPFVRAGNHVEVFAPHTAGAEAGAALTMLRVAVSRALPAGSWALRPQPLSRGAAAHVRWQVHVRRGAWLAQIEGTWLGGLLANTSSEAADGDLLRLLQQDACLRRYRQHHRADPGVYLVYSETALLWRCPHPPLELLTNGSVYIPDSVEEGLYTGHVTLTGDSAAQAYLGGRRWIFSKQAVRLSSLDPLESPEAFLQSMLAEKGLRIERFAQCAYRVCGDAEGTTPRCDLGSSARYPWESATSLAVSECFAASVTAQNLIDWTGEAMQECHQISVPFPEDTGVNYLPQARSPDIEDLHRCLREWRVEWSSFLELSGAVLNVVPPDSTGRMHRLRQQRHQCRSQGHRYLIVHALNSVGLCAPSCCPLEAAAILSWRTSLKDLPVTHAQGMSLVSEKIVRLAADGSLDMDEGIQQLGAEDPRTGSLVIAPNRRAGAPPCWSVPLSAVAGIDFILAGFPRAGTTTVHSNLEQHPEVTFSEESSSQFEDALFSVTHTSCLRARERRLFRGEGSRRRRVFGIYDSNLVLQKNAVSQLRSVHRRRPVKLVVAVRHPIELLESNLNYVPPQVTADFLNHPETFLQTEWLKFLLPSWTEESLLLVPLDALARHPRAALNRICRFLGIAPFSHSQKLVLGNARPRGPWSVSLASPPAPQLVGELLYQYYVDDAAALRQLVQRFGGWQGFGPLLVGPPCPREAREDEEARCFAERLRSNCCHDLGNLNLPCTREPVELPEQQRRCQHSRKCCERFKALHLELTKALWRHTCGGDVVAKDMRSCFWRFGWVPEVRLGRRPLVQLSEDAARSGQAVAIARHHSPWTNDELDRDGDMRDERVIGQGAPFYGVLEEKGDRDIAQCHSLRGMDRAKCLLRVRVKDPWGCHRQLRPDWARGNAWVNCCGAAGLLYARVILTPCPGIQCCVTARLSNTSKMRWRHAVYSEGNPITPPWLTCAKVPNKRWLDFRRSLLQWPMDPKRHGTVAVELLESTFTDGDPVREVLRRLEELTKSLGSKGPDPALCFVGYATALYVAAVSIENEREWYRWQLQVLLNVGKSANPDLAVLSLFLDMGGWPIPAAKLVGFALGALPPDFADNGGSLPGSFPWLELPALPALTAAPADTELGVPPPNPDTGQPLSLLLISSHLFALDAALALAAALATAGGTGALRWLGFPEKFSRKKLPHTQRICSSKLPSVTCGGPGALALDRLLELISIGRLAKPGSWREAPHSKFWPHNVRLDRPHAKVRLGGIAWGTLVDELSALLTDLGEGPILCGYPAVLCMALNAALRRGGHRRFLAIAISGTPVEYAEADLQPKLWRILRDMNGQPDRALFCVSHFDEAHLWVAVQLRVPRPTFGARYIASAVAPDAFAAPTASPEAVLIPPVVKNEASKQILVSRIKLAVGARGAELMWQLLDDLCGGHFCPYRFTSYEVFFDWNLLNDFRAGVFFPWNWELITFLEWYSLGIPVFVPGTSWMVPLILQSLKGVPKINENGTDWVNLRPEWAHGVSDQAQPETTVENVARWWARTDYTRLPHTRSFAHLGDLVQQVGGCDFRAWTAMLHRENVRAHRAAANWYLQLAGRVQGAMAPDPKANL